jgi:preprotein translocase subunit SecD
VYFPLWKKLLVIGVTLLGVLIALPNAFYGRVERANDARAAIAAGQAATSELLADAAGWPGWLPHGLVPLGLDLRGGAHVLVQVETQDVYVERMEGLWPTVRDRLRDLRDQVGTVRRLDSPPDELHIRLSQPAGMDAAVEAVAAAAQPVFSITGGASL